MQQPRSQFRTNWPRGCVFLYPPAPGGGGLGAAEAANPTQPGPRAGFLCPPAPGGGGLGAADEASPTQTGPGAGFCTHSPPVGRLGCSSRCQSPTNWLQGWFFMPTRPRWGGLGAAEAASPTQPGPRAGFVVPTRPRWGRLGCSRGGQPHTTRPRGWVCCTHPPPVGAAWVQQMKPVPHKPAPGLDLLYPPAPAGEHKAKGRLSCCTGQTSFSIPVCRWMVVYSRWSSKKLMNCS